MRAPLSADAVKLSACRTNLLDISNLLNHSKYGPDLNYINSVFHKMLNKNNCITNKSPKILYSTEDDTNGQNAHTSSKIHVDFKG